MKMKTWNLFKYLVFASSIITGIETTCLGEEIFRIGTPDARSDEFKIFRNLEDSRYTYQRVPNLDTPRARPFRDVDNIAKFFEKPIVFEVGKSTEKDFPFIHAIKSCVWKAHTRSLSIKFKNPNTTKKELFFRIGFSDMSDLAPISLEILLNGKSIGKVEMINKDKGFGATLAYNPQSQGIPYSLTFKIDTSLLAENNIIQIKPFSKGKAWFTYDYIELSDSPNAPKIHDCRDDILDNAIKAMGTELVVFSQRGEGRDYHWYSTIGRTCWVKTGVKQIDDRFDCEMFSRLGGRLCVYNLKTGELKKLIDDPDGCVRDHTISYDGKKILFSWRKGKSDDFHLYEIDIDGKNLTKLPIARKGINDIEPCYLPNGDIVFSSSRMGKVVQCFFMPVTDIHRWYKQENKIAVISQNPDVDSTASVLPDGRLIYMRWDYNQRNQLAFHHLWTMNPDGSNDTVYFGNNKPGHLFISPQPIPDENGAVFTFGYGHGTRDSFGHIAKVLQPCDPSDPYASKFITGDISLKFNRPQPLGNGYTMATDGREIYIFNKSGQYKKVSNLPEEIFKTDRVVRMSVVGWKNGKDKIPAQCKIIAQGAMPLKGRAMPIARPDMSDLSQKKATVFLQDVYHGRNMKGVERGSIDKLLILQVLPTPAHYNGGSNQLNRLGGFALERILGTVPVEKDGSANFEVPTQRALAFVALDKNGNAVKRMQSFVSFAPATNTSCIGCHENRTEAPLPKKKLPLAYSRISKIKPYTQTHPIEYRTQIQPLLDKYCMECHNERSRASGVVLDGGLGANFIHSYIVLDERGQLITGRNQYGDMPPYTFGSGSSPILDKFTDAHCGATPTKEELDILKRWLDTGAMQIGTYAALNTGFLHSYLQGGVVRHEDENPENVDAYKAIENACFKCHSGEAEIARRPFEPKQNYGETVFDYRASFESACVEKVKFKKKDGKIRESKLIADLLYNFTDPEDSLALIIPLSKEHGGTATDSDDTHPIVFKDKSDPNYQAILSAITAAKKSLEKKSPFCDSPDFRPTAGYIKKLKDLKILPSDFSLNGKINPQKSDSMYFDWLDKNAVIDAIEK